MTAPAGIDSALAAAASAGKVISDNRTAAVDAATAASSEALPLAASEDAADGSHA